MTKKNLQMKWLLTVLLLVAAMAMPSMVWAEISISQPSTGTGTSDDPYQITNANELYWFAGLVNGTIGLPNKKPDACAKLMNNITVNSSVLKSDGTINSGSFTAWEPIGYFNSSSDYVIYSGTFDGNGKTISGLYLSNNSLSYMGLFGYSSGTIKNVGVIDSYFKGYEYIGGVCGYNAGTVTLCYSNSYLSGTNIGGVCGLNHPGANIANCYHTGTVNGGTNVGGVCGANSSGATITNCHNVGTLSGTTVGSVCGKNTGGAITNCYYDSDKCTIKGIGGADAAGQAEGKTTAQFQSGEVAIDLQGSQSETIWGQTLGTDSYPVIGGKEVYYGYTDCQTGMKYTNTVASETPLHSYDNGFCTLCDGYQPAEYVDENHHPELLPEYRGYYAIENAGQLYWFANRVNNDKYNSIDAVLTGHITVNSGVIDNNGELASNTSGFRKWTPIGWWTETGSVKYNGIIDGNNHQITGLYFNDENTDNVGLLGYAMGTVRNLGIIGSYFKGGNNVGAMYGYGIARVINCFSFNCQVHGNTCVGGMCGRSYGEVSILCNSYMAGTVSGTTSVGSMCGLCEQESAIVANCYYDKEKCSIGAIGGSDVAGKAEGKTLAEFQSGKIAYRLSLGCTVGGEEYDGSNWGQWLKLLDYPVLWAKKVYYGYPSQSCIATYSNNKLNDTPTHTFGDNGFCTACTTGYQPAKLVSNTNHSDLLETHNGYYAIENGGQLYWFAKQVNNGNPSINAVLTTNITIHTEVLRYDGSLNTWSKIYVAWIPIGFCNSESDSLCYTGTFDGNGKTISGLYYDNTNTNYVGLFGYSNGKIMNVGILDSYIVGNEYVGGICGYSKNIINNCYCNGTVKGKNNVGGLCGEIETECIITNCFSKGIVSGSGDNVGGICGYTYSAKVTNSYNEASVSGKTNAGGVCGQNINTPVADCYNVGTVVATGDGIGGICGRNQGSSVDNCYNSGVVRSNAERTKSSNHLGGICGVIYSSSINYCYNTGEIGVKTGTDPIKRYYVGGVCGEVHGSIQNCYNAGYVEGSDYVGGVCGELVTGTITNCINTNSSVYGLIAGGICGRNYSSIKDCYDNHKRAIGDNPGNLDKVEHVETKSIAQFESGEVGYLLAQGTDGFVWGQQLGTDQYPVLNSEYKVLKAAQDGQESTIYWATFSNLDNDATLSVPADRTLKVYDATVSGGALTLTERNDCQVAKGEGILLKTDGEYVNAKANETDVLAKADYTDNNLVATPSEAQTITADEGYTLYRLTYNNVETKEGLGFYLGVVGSVKDGSQLKAIPGKAYLKVASSETANARGFAFMEDEDDATSIKCVTVTDEASHGNAGNADDSMYDLGGRKVSNPAKGLYIRNGKKVIIK